MEEILKVDAAPLLGRPVCAGAAITRYTRSTGLPQVLRRVRRGRWRSTEASKLSVGRLPSAFVFDCDTQTSSTGVHAVQVGARSQYFWTAPVCHSGPSANSHPSQPLFGSHAFGRVEARSRQGRPARTRRAVATRRVRIAAQLALCAQRTRVVPQVSAPRPRLSSRWPS